MLKEKIKDKSAKIGIIGLGYVGLPLAVLCAEKGYKVVGFDIDENKIKSLCDGKSYISDVSHAKIQSIINSNKLDVTKDFSLIYSCHILIICVPTPLAGDGKPNYSFLFSAVESITDKLKYEQLIILESTLVPQTTSKKIIPTLEKSGLKAGDDFSIAYSPERIDPGNEAYNLQTIPKLVSGYTEKCRNLAETFYRQLNIKTFAVSSSDIAEMAKILENTYRDVNIALINEMAQICYSHGLNIWEVIDAAASKPFGYNAFYPGPGVGGHCIPKDSSFYAYWARENGKPATLAECARKINDNMPNYIIKRLEEILLSKKKNLSGSKVLILGATYKKDVNDLRKSPVIKLIELLIAKGVEVFFHDPYIEQLNICGNVLKRIDYESINEIEKDCIIFAVAHSLYLNYETFNSSLVFDLTNTMDKNERNIVTL